MELWAEDDEITMWGSDLVERAVGRGELRDLATQIADAPSVLEFEWDERAEHEEGDVAWVNAAGSLHVDDSRSDYRITVVLVRRGSGLARAHVQRLDPGLNRSGLQPADQRERRGVAVGDVAAERGDPRGARVLGEPVDEHRANAFALERIGNRERDLADVAVTDEPRDPDRLTLDDGDQHVVFRVDAREQLEVRRQEHVLRATEPE